MNAYSKDLRLRALEAVDRSQPRTEISELFRVSLSTIKRWVKKSCEGEDLEPRHSTARKRRILATLEEKRQLWKQIEENDEATLERHWKARTLDALFETTHHALAMVSTQDARGFFEHCGYSTPWAHSM